MKALLLAAGFGTRLKPLTDTIPKCLVPINGKPLLEYWLDMIEYFNLSSKDQMIDQVIVNTHYLSDQVCLFLKSYIADKKTFSIKNVYEEDLLGTGGTVAKNSSLLQNETILIAHADNLSFFSLSDFYQAHSKRPKDSIVTMMLFKAQDPKLCGVVKLDSDDVIVDFAEKVENPPSDLANAAVYFSSPEFTNFIVNQKNKHGRDFLDISTEVIPLILGKIYSYKNDFYHRDIGNSESYHSAQNEIRPFLEKNKQFNFVRDY